jgi:ribosomal protein S18 acetylase RimI-like enzyme
MPDFCIRPFEPADETAVIHVWQVCQLTVPQNNPQKDIARKLQVNPEWFLVGTLGDVLIGTCMVGYEGHRGWINYLAVHPDYQRQGFARRLMAQAETLLRAAGCPKINLQVRHTNTAVIRFYESLGFRDDKVISLGKRLEVDREDLG